MALTEPFPEALLNEIKRLHPKLTDEDFKEYLRLIDDAYYTDPIEYPEQNKKARERLDEFVRTHLPRLEEAQSSYNKKIGEIHVENMLAELPSPVDIALADNEVARWIRERTAKLGVYSASSKLIRDPDVYVVEFRFEDDSVMRVQVERLSNVVSLIFKRTVLSDT